MLAKLWEGMRKHLINRMRIRKTIQKMSAVPDKLKAIEMERGMKSSLFRKERQPSVATSSPLSFPAPRLHILLPFLALSFAFSEQS